MKVMDDPHQATVQMQCVILARARRREWNPQSSAEAQAMLPNAEHKVPPPARMRTQLVSNSTKIPAARIHIPQQMR
jgi:hypothetical protein